MVGASSSKLSLGGGVWYSLKEEESGKFETEFSLFPGVQGADVRAIRIDNLERNVLTRFERRPSGEWWIIDPLDAPADGDVLGVLLNAIETHKAHEVPKAAGEELDPAKIGLDPPRVVIDVSLHEEVGGETLRVEIGSVDFTKDWVYVRVGGRLLRTLRTIDSIVKRGINDYRQQTMFNVRTDTVYEIHRKGSFEESEQRFGFELHAFLENDGWRLESPFRAALHPGPMSLLLANVTRIRAESFIAKHESDLAAFGFDQPTVTVEVGTSSGDKRALELGRKTIGRHYFCREVGLEEVIRVRDRDLIKMTVPIELLLDRRLVRAPLELVDRIEIESPDHSLRLARSLEDGVGEAWQVGSGDEELVRVDEREWKLFLSDLESAEFFDFLDPGALSEDERHGSIRFLGADEEWEVAIGAEHEEDGRKFRRVQRRGDGIVALLEIERLAFLQETVESLRDRQLTFVDELQVTSLSVSDGAREKRYERDEKGKWTRSGQSAEAFEILMFVDALLNLRARRFLGAEETQTFENPIEIVITAASGETKVTIGKLGENDVAKIDASGAELDRQGLHYDLGRLLDKAD